MRYFKKLICYTSRIFYFIYVITLPVTHRLTGIIYKCHSPKFKILEDLSNLSNHISFIGKIFCIMENFICNILGGVMLV